MEIDCESEDLPGHVELPANLTTWQLARLAVYPEPRVRAGVALHSHTNEQTLRFLSYDRMHHVRVAIASRKRASFQTLMWLATDENTHVRAAVAKNARTPSDALDKMAKDPLMYIRKLVARHPATRLPTLVWLATEGGVYASAFIKRDTLPMEVMAVLAEKEDEAGLVELSCDARTPGEIVAGFLGKLSPEAVATICARRPARQREIERIRNADARREHDRTWKTLNDPQATPEALFELAHNVDINVRVSIAKHPNVCMQTLAILASDSLIAKIILERESLALKVIEAIQAHEDAQVQIRLARHPSTTAQAFDILVERGDDNVLQYAVQNPAVPKHVLEVLAKHTNPGIRRAVASSGQTPRHVLDELTKDVKGRVSTAARENLSSRRHIQVS